MVSRVCRGLKLSVDPLELRDMMREGSAFALDVRRFDEYVRGSP
jgi:rhodanese-related sulfurtransferase